jgi:hypothetical protein
MPSPMDERAPRKPTTTPPAPLASAAPSAPTPLPSAGGKSASPAKFTPKYVPRLINYQVAEYQDEKWRE